MRAGMQHVLRLMMYVIFLSRRQAPPDLVARAPFETERRERKPGLGIGHRSASRRETYDRSHDRDVDPDDACQFR